MAFQAVASSQDARSPEPHGAASPRNWRWSALLIALVVLPYLPSLRNGWIWDDDYYITANPTLTSLDGLRRIWFEIGAVPQYYPLVHTTFWVEHHLWGTRPLGYHLDNILLHALGAILLWRLLARLNVPAPWAAAALWAVHPLQVESVAWATERKNVLCGVFLFASLIAYLRFDTSRSTRHYLTACALFLLALLSKTIACSMPAVVLVILWWKRPTLRWRDIFPLIPLLIVGAAMGILTGWMEREVVGARGPEWSIPFLSRCIIAGRAIWFYLGKLLWPWPLMFVYPRWEVAPKPALLLFPLSVLMALIILIAQRNRWGRAPAAAALIFIGTLFPALGFVNTLPMRYSFVADHFQYLSGAAVIAGLASILSVMLPRRAAMILCCTAIALFSILSLHHSRAFANAETLWRDTLARNPSAWIAHNNLGVILLERNDLPGATGHFQSALNLKPDHPEARLNLGMVAEKQQHWDDAVRWYHDALEVRPDYPEAYYNLGGVLAKQNELPQAIKAYQRALALKPSYPQARRNLAILLNRIGASVASQDDLPQAQSILLDALRADPDLVDAHVNLGIVLEKQGKFDSAQEQYRAALKLDPINTRARQRLRGG
ncbi:MAG TPA: tetratricopeptide repeat protein [Tepidisphaeraceae bacterium]|jgi:tetratricopeptide (TPR) repeat protein